jgi:molybdate transport system substrate-binding protein
MPASRAIAALFVFSLFGVQAQAADLKVVSTTAFKSVLEELGPQFEKTTESKVSFTFAPTAVIKTQIEQGAAFDVAVLTSVVNDGLAAAGKVPIAARRSRAPAWGLQSPMVWRSLTSARSTRSSRHC